MPLPYVFFLTVGQMGCRNIRIFVTGTSYVGLPTMHADMPVESFDAFPKEFHVRRRYMTFIRNDWHTHVKVLKIRLPVWGRYFLKGASVKAGCNLVVHVVLFLHPFHDARTDPAFVITKENPTNVILPFYSQLGRIPVLGWLSRCCLYRDIQEWHSYVGWYANIWVFDAFCSCCFLIQDKDTLFL